MSLVSQEFVPLLFDNHILVYCHLYVACASACLVHRHFGLPPCIMTKPSISALTSGLVEQQTRKLI